MIYNLILLFEVKILFEIGNTCVGTILVCAYSKQFRLCILPIEWTRRSEFLRIMTRTLCLGTAKCVIFNIIWEEILLIFFRHFVERALSKSLHDQSFLDYFWDISRDWERLQRTTTLHGRLYNTVYFWQIDIK